MKKAIIIHDKFWTPKIDKMCREIIPYQYEVLNDAVPGIPSSHAIENFRIAAGEAQGTYQGMLFQDSDVAKWMEAASYALETNAPEGLEEKMDGLVDLLERAQCEDGYLNSYYTNAGKEKRFTNISHGHELYCAGHLIEAAVAYAQATGKEKFLNLMERYTAYLISVIGAEEGKRAIYSGHPEIELALYKLYQYTGNETVLEFMEYLLKERGKQPSFLETEESFGEQYKDKWFALPYHQAHAPVWEQSEAVGHSVRAVYLYCAMTDLAVEKKSEAMAEHMRKLWKDVVNKKMYITGAIGSQAHGECFSKAYDLPNDRAYAETCASIGMIFWAQRMLRMEKKSTYADVMERVLYNGALSGMAADGKHYFYVNPLEMKPEDAIERYDMQHVKVERETWMGCACCPPNIARLMTSLHKYVSIEEEETKSLYINLYMSGKLIFGKGSFSVESKYLEEGSVRFTYNGETEIKTICLRVPEWANTFECYWNKTERITEELQNGYLCIKKEFHDGDEIEFVVPIYPRLIYANPRIKADAGKVALMRGPVVYCLEEKDNGKDLSAISVSNLRNMRETVADDLPGNEIAVIFSGYRDSEEGWEASLYQEKEIERESVMIRAVPYHVWGNRGVGEMLVWMRKLD